MQGARGPWWVLAVAAGVLGYLVLNIYAELFGPGAIGVDLRYHDGRAIVMAVVPDFPAARAGIGPGDAVVTADGQPIRTLFHWHAVLENAEAGRPLLLEIEGGGTRTAVQLGLHPNSRQWNAGNWVTFGIKLTAQVVTFSLVLLIAVRATAWRSSARCTWRRWRSRTSCR